MKKNKSIYWVFFGILLIALWNISFHFISKKYHESIISKKKMYCYEEDSNEIKRALYVTEEGNIDSLVEYYKKKEGGIQSPVINFFPASFPYDTCVYVLSYSKDSLVAEVGCFTSNSNYLKGFVYIKTLHSIQPPNFKSNN